MLRNKQALIIYKLFFALLGLSTLLTEIVVLIGRDRFNPINFFSYFTVESNSLVDFVLLLSAWATFKGTPNRFSALRSAATVYILVVGIGFSFLLAGLKGVELTAVPWDNVVLHYIMPMAVLADFLFDRPRRTMSFVKSLAWLLFPAVYLAYSLARGHLTGWYPYPFLNPSLKGYTPVILTSLGLCILGIILIWLIHGLQIHGREHRQK